MAYVIDKLTGLEETPLKKMCLNCIDCVENEDGTFACKNEDVLEKGKQKIMESVPEGFEIESLTMKPMALKAPTKKCGNYEVNENVITEVINKIFYE